MSSTDLPFVAEYAKSSRSSCKLCKSQISKDDLRIGVMVQSPHFDGKVPLWHHFKCFFEKKKIEATGDIGNFSSLRYEDQQRLKEKVGVAPPSAAAGKKSKSKPKSDAAGTPFSVEYAKSSRSSCKVCSESIQKGVVRISKLDYESEIARRYGPSPAWHHVDCFVRMKDALGFTDSAQDLPGFSSLEEEDQKELKAKLKGSKSTKKRPPAVEEKPAAKKVKKEESSRDKALKAQSDLLFGFRDALEANLQKNQMVELLELNNQAVPSGVSNILDALADCLAFGALKKCPECQNGLRFKDGTYKCSGYVTGWTKCVYETKSPERSKFVIPDEYKEGYDFLKKYKYVKRSRIFPEETNSGASTSNGSSTALHNMKIALAGFPDEKTTELQKLISSLGGEYVPKVKKGVTCVVASEDKKEEYASAMKRAKQGNVTVVSESFLDAVKGGGKKAAYLLKEHSLKPWGIGMASEASTSKKSGSKELKSAEKVKKVVVQGVAEVDPDSGLADEAHVLTHKNDTYNCVLGMVDVARGTNSYYKLQILKHNKKERYYVFRAWGRVGTTVGGNKTEKFDDRSDAVQNFQEIYLDKTGNEWADRANFVKKPNRFYPLDIDYGQDQIEEMQKLQPGSSSKLSKPVQELICLIFDVAAMKKALMEFEIDLQKMPLGKLSKNQIMQAYSVLSELQKVLQDGGTQVKIVDASNRFYTLIPHDFGMVNPPLLDSEEAIKSKTAMLDSLLEIECAYKLLKSADDQKDPIDHHYEQLKADIEVLDKASGEFKDIETYLKNTHAPTHSMYNLVLEEVFKVNRHGEADNYRKKYSELQNKKLLWHGSRITNFAGIISQGLRIAPPEAPVTGYMFGKGIYFADMVSKSANYCFTNRQNPTGLLLLCEVALGDMYERTRADFITTLPSNKHSTKGLGKTVPDPKGAVVRNGVEIPCGKPVSSDIKNSALLYNEYIVYDVNQVNAKYLLRVRFDWK